MRIPELRPCRACGCVPYVSGTLRLDRPMYEVLHHCEAGNVPVGVSVGPCRDEPSCAEAWNRLMGGEDAGSGKV